MRLGGEIISLNCCKWLQIKRTFYQVGTHCITDGVISARMEVHGVAMLRLRCISLYHSDLPISDGVSGSGGLRGVPQQDKGKTLGFSPVWRLPPQKRTLAQKTV